MGPGRGCSSPGEDGRKAVKGPPQRPVGAQLVGFFVFDDEFPFPL